MPKDALGEKWRKGGQSACTILGGRVRIYSSPLLAESGDERTLPLSLSNGQSRGEYLSVEFERELQRLTEEQGLEREGRTPKHRERQRLGEKLERERLARPPGISGTSNAFSETFGIDRSYSRSCSRLSRLGRRTVNRPLK